MIIGISGKIGSGKDTVAKMIQYCFYLEQGYTPYSNIEQFLNNRDVSDEGREVNSDWKIKRFADKLKDIVCLLIGCSREQLEDREFKEKPLGEEWTKWIVIHNQEGETHKEVFSTEEEALSQREYYKGYRDSVEVKKVVLTPRKLMQLLGTEAGREIIHPNIWVNALFAEYGLKPGYEHREGVTIPEARTAKFPDWIIPDTRFPNEAKAIKDRGGILIRVHRNIDKRFPKLWTEFGYDGNKAMLRNDFYVFLKKHHPEMYRKLTHASETGLDVYEGWDYTISNNGTMRTLLDVIKNIMEEIE